MELGVQVIVDGRIHEGQLEKVNSAHQTAVDTSVNNVTVVSGSLSCFVRVVVSYLLIYPIYR